ncbi:MAG: hypothetical protein LUD27_07665 [Clostridia bacterium]|nr:hypothetical protein [Clostridia bacterium]
MRVVDGTIEIERRDELDTMIAMIECYLAHAGEIPDDTKEDLQQLRQQLDVLWLAW